MAQTDIGETTALDEGLDLLVSQRSRKSGQPRTPIHADPADELELDVAAADAEEKAEKPPSHSRNRKARRAAQSKRKHKSKDEDDATVDDDDDDANLKLSPSEILELLKTELSVPPPIAGAAFGLGRNASSDACNNGQLPAFKLGHKLSCPTAPLRRMLGIEPPMPGDIPAPQIAMQPKKQEVVKSPKRHRGR
jgi:hypothetical protein